MEQGKEKSEEEQQQSEDLQTIMRQILQTINRQVLGLASTIAFYNLHLLLQNSQAKPLTITVAGLQYTGNVKLLKRHYLLEQDH
jgi:hypothetical protein